MRCADDAQGHSGDDGHGVCATAEKHAHALVAPPSRFSGPLFRNFLRLQAKSSVGWSALGRSEDLELGERCAMGDKNEEKKGGKGKEKKQEDGAAPAEKKSEAKPEKKEEAKSKAAAAAAPVGSGGTSMIAYVFIAVAMVVVAYVAQASSDVYLCVCAMRCDARH
eukprot:3627064-Rhodomonas_salina.3